MKLSTKQKILFGVILVGIIGATILLTTLFGAKKKTDSKYFDLLLKEKDLRITEEKERTKTEANYRMEEKQEYQERLYKDSVLNARFLANQKNYIVLNNRINDIPVNIQRIANNDDSIRSAFAK